MILKLSVSSYYQWQRRKPSNRDIEHIELDRRITEIYERSHKSYGSPRISQELCRSGFKVSRKRVMKRMRYLNICSIHRKKYRAATERNRDYSMSENILNRSFSVSRLNRYWVGDITYIPVNGEWLYLTTVIDLADRQIVGWSMSEGMTAEETSIRAFEMAKLKRNPKSALVFHSDQGSQYGAEKFRKALLDAKAVQSMSRKGNCWDNAVAESFFKTLKQELIYQRKFQTKSQARTEIFDWIERWYNRQRIHSALGYKTPMEMQIFLEQQNKQLVA